MKYYVNSGVHYSLRRKINAAVLALIVSIGVPVVFAAWQGTPGIVTGPNSPDRETKQPAVTLDKPDEKEAEITKEPSVDNDTEEEIENVPQPSTEVSNNTQTEEPVQNQDPPPSSSRPVGGRGGGPPPPGTFIDEEEVSPDSNQADSTDAISGTGTDTATGK